MTERILVTNPGLLLQFLHGRYEETGDIDYAETALAVAQVTGFPGPPEWAWEAVVGRWIDRIDEGPIYQELMELATGQYVAAESAVRDKSIKWTAEELSDELGESVSTLQRRARAFLKHWRIVPDAAPDDGRDSVLKYYDIVPVVHTGEGHGSTES